MGIYDREYVRQSSGGFFGGFASAPVCKWLILINIGVFILQVITMSRGDGMPQAGDEQALQTWNVTDWLILNPSLVMEGQVWRLLTYAFLHSTDQILHIVFNLLLLWWFGNELEQIYGSKEFLTFYLVAALLGGIVYTAFAVFTGDLAEALGASGAVIAVMVVYAFHFPMRTVLFMFIIPMPIWVLVTLLVALDTFVLFGGVRTQTAVTIHLAGAAFGALYYKLHLRLSRFWRSIRLPDLRRRGGRLRIYREEQPRRDTSKEVIKVGVNEQFEAKLDAVLSKIQRTGQESLTEDERRVLLQASELYKQRRSTQS